jgi:hypothetical protein
MCQPTWENIKNPTWIFAQVVDHLLSRYGALSSNPSTAKKKKKKIHM